MADVELRLDRAALTRLLESEQGDVGRFLDKKGQKAKEVAEHLVPVDKGDLKASIYSKLERDSKGLAVAVGATDPAALYVELGTRFRPATPFLRPSIK